MFDYSEDDDRPMTYAERSALRQGRHARPVYDLEAIPEDPALATEPECCT